MHRDSAGLYYRPFFGRSVPLSFSPAGMSKLFAHEIRNEGEVRKFVESGGLAYCVYVCCSVGGDELITSAAVPVGPKYRNDTFERPLSKEEAKALTRGLRRYASGLQYSKDGQMWRVGWIARNPNGGIDGIIVLGGTNPLRVVDVKRETVLPDFTFRQRLPVGR